jgi:hypothetical protein
MCLLSDKIAMRDYVKSRLGDGYLPDRYFCDSKLSASTFNDLPDQFVLKANHGAGFVKIEPDKSSVSFAELHNISQRWLAIDFSKNWLRELQYAGIEPKVFAEQFIGREDKSARDYKFNIFRKKPGAPASIFIEVHDDRFSNYHHATYDSKWQRLKISKGSNGVKKQLFDLVKPDSFEEMKRIALMLSQDFNYVRVDLYEYNKKPVVGELTFTPRGGHKLFDPATTDHDWGKLFVLEDGNSNF